MGVFFVVLFGFVIGGLVIGGYFVLIDDDFEDGWLNNELNFVIDWSVM